MTDFNIQDQETLTSAIYAMAARIVAVERRSQGPYNSTSSVEVDAFVSMPDATGPDEYCFVRSTGQWYATQASGSSSPPAPPRTLYSWVTSGPPPN